MNTANEPKWYITLTYTHTQSVTHYNFCTGIKKNNIQVVATNSPRFAR